MTATRSAVRSPEITQGSDPASAEERHHNKAVESLLVRASDGQRPISEDELCEAFDAKETQQTLSITDALNRFDAAGLIERRGGRAIASRGRRLLRPHNDALTLSALRCQTAPASPRLPTACRFASTAWADPAWAVRALCNSCRFAPAAVCRRCDDRSQHRRRQGQRLHALPEIKDGPG